MKRSREEEERHALWHQAVMVRGAAMLPRLRRLGRAELLALAHQADEHSAREPLHLMGSSPRYSVPLWSEDPLTAAQVVAILVFGLWVLCGESKEIGGALLNDWPEIETAMLMAARPDGAASDDRPEE